MDCVGLEGCMIRCDSLRFLWLGFTNMDGRHGDVVSGQ